MEERVYVKVVGDSNGYIYYLSKENWRLVRETGIYTLFMYADYVVRVSDNNLIKHRCDIGSLVEGGIGKIITEDEALGVPSKEEILSWLPRVVTSYDSLASSIHNKLKERMRNES